MKGSVNITSAAFKLTTKLGYKIDALQQVANLLLSIRYRGNTTALKTIDDNILIVNSVTTANGDGIDKFISLRNLESATTTIDGSNATVNFDNSAVNAIVFDTIESLEISESFINDQNSCIIKLQANVEKHLLLYFGNITTINKIIASIESNTKSIKWWQFLKLHRSKKNILENVARLRTFNAEIYSSTASMKYANDGAINMFTNENV